MAKVKQCKMCGTTFLTETGRKQYCCDCNTERRAANSRGVRYKKQQPRPPKVSIHDILRWAKEHKEKTGVYLDYSKAREEMKKEGYPV